MKLKIIIISTSCTLVLLAFLSVTITRNLKSQKDLLAKWENNQYNLLYDDYHTLLLDDPTNPTYLYILGSSAFYLAIAEIEEEPKQHYLEQATIYFNKLLLLYPQFKEKNMTYYLLGRTLTHKGVYYADEALQYLLLAKENSVKMPDLNEYLGVNYSYLEQNKLALQYLETIDSPSRQLENKIEQLKTQLDTTL